ncbi:TPA: PadR family transcriptional regulator [bacterium]|jgi:PadR family transcriptional regulator PadR|nr:PadR family transcriptional regulator [bacterium]
MNIFKDGSMLELCVLAICNNEDIYGYLLTKRLQTEIKVSISTLYPILRRLTSKGLLTSYEKEFEGRKRKYYKITNKGKSKLANYTKLWEINKQKIDLLLYGRVKDEQAGIH